MLAQGIGLIIYSRNLFLIYNKKMKIIKNYINGTENSFSKNF